jgi:hypothetical protein
VQFKLDGANLGAEVTTLPTAISWDTTTVTDGVHVLTAAARDPAGNIAHSSPVTVTVKNMVRFEETDPAARSGPCAWYANTFVLYSGGRAIRSSAPGTQVAFDFTGTAVSWIGYRDASSGIADVYLDGQLKATVDAFVQAPQAQAVLFSVSGLSAGTHRLVIVVTGNQNPLSGGSSVWVDAFDVLSVDGKVNRFEETDPTVHSIPCAWYRSGSPPHSGGSAILSAQAGAQVDFDFTGTAVRWIGFRDGWSGIAAVYIDGVFNAQIDAYASDSEAQATIYAVGGLPRGTHRLTIQVTGRQNPASAGAWIWVDAFDVSP